MAHQRRRAEDFTDSLSSFRQTMSSETDFNYINDLSNCRDSLECATTCKYNCADKDSLLSSTHAGITSLIIAGNVAQHCRLHADVTSSQVFTDSLNMMSNESENCLNRRMELFEDSSLNERTINERLDTCKKQNLNAKADIMTDTTRAKCNMEHTSMRFSPLCQQAMTNSFNQNTLKSTANLTNDCCSQSFCNDKHHSSTMKSQASDDEDLIEDTSADVPNSFITALSSLDQELNQRCQNSAPRKILRRLSQQFAESPKTFTERLITIIEESLPNNDEEPYSHSDVDLSRLTTEFRKMCKYIEDETMPEWSSPVSLDGVSFTEEARRVELQKCMCDTRDNQERNVNSLISSTINIASVSPSVALKNTCVETPKSSGTSLDMSFLSLEVACGISCPSRTINSTECTPRPFHANNAEIECINRICERQMASLNDSHNSLDDTFNDTSFKRLEMACNISIPSKSRNADENARMSFYKNNMEYIRSICDQQLASLGNFDAHQKMLNCENKFFSQSPCFKTHNETSHYRKRLEQLKRDFTKQQECHSNEENLAQKHTSHSDIDYSNSKSNNKNSTADLDDLEKTFLHEAANKRRRCFDTVTLVNNKNLTADPDDLEKTFLHEVTNKRRRCFDTAMTLMKINAKPGSSMAQALSPSLPLHTSQCKTYSPVETSKNFLHTLRACEKYYYHLERLKTLFKSRQSIQMDETEGTQYLSIEDKVRYNSEKENLMSTPKTSHLCLDSQISPIQNVRTHTTQNFVNKPVLFGSAAKSRGMRRERKKFFFS